MFKELLDLNNCQLQIVENLVIKASEMFEVPPTAILGKSKKEEYCIVRAILWVVCKNKLCLTFRDIALYFDGRHHTTVLSGYNNMRDELEVNRERMIIYKKLANG